MRAVVVLVAEDEVRVVAAVTVTTGLEFPVVWGVEVEVVVVLETVINIVVVVDATVLDLSVVAVTPPPGSAPVAEALVEESQVVVTR